VDAIQFQISFRDLRTIASNFYELVCRKGINFLNVSSQRSTVLVSLFSSQHSTLNSQQTQQLEIECCHVCMYKQKPFSLLCSQTWSAIRVYQTSPTEEALAWHAGCRWAQEFSGNRSETTAGALRIYHHTIVTSQSLQHDFYWTKMRPEINYR